MLTAKDGDLDEAEALDTGADDYLTKPFSFPVLVARIRALLRRGRRARPVPVTVGRLRLDPAARRVWSGGDEVELTPREFDVLEFLVRRAGQVVSKDEILAGVWEFDFDGDPNIVEVYVGRLRRKLDEPFGTRAHRDRSRRRLPPGRRRCAERRRLGSVRVRASRRWRRSPSLRRARRRRRRCSSCCSGAGLHRAARRRASQAEAARLAAALAAARRGAGARTTRTVWCRSSMPTGGSVAAGRDVAGLAARCARRHRRIDGRRTGSRRRYAGRGGRRQRRRPDRRHRRVDRRARRRPWR